MVCELNRYLGIASLHHYLHHCSARNSNNEAALSLPGPGRAVVSSGIGPLMYNCKNHHQASSISPAAVSALIRLMVSCDRIAAQSVGEVRVYIKLTKYAPTDAGTVFTRGPIAIIVPPD